MKRFLKYSILAVLIFLIGSVALAGQKSPIFSERQPGGTWVYSDQTNTTGNIWWVDSGATTTGADEAGYGQSPNSPCLTLDYAVGLATASNGDKIVLMAGHAETMDEADEVDIDVAGLKVIGLGEGATRPTFTYTDTDGEFIIGAANVTVENVRFVAGISEVVFAISVEAAGDNFTLKNCEFPEPGTSSYEFLDAIDLETTANDVKILDCEYYHTAATGPAHFVEAGNGTNHNLQIIGNKIHGQFSVAAIWSDTADLRCTIKDNEILQMTADQYAIEFTGNATGIIDGNVIYCNAQGTSIDPGTFGIGVNYVTTAGDVSASVYPVVDSGWGKLGDYSGDGGADQDDSVKASLDLAHTDLDSLLAASPQGMAYSATVTSSADTTHSVYSALTGHGDGFFVTDWTMIVVYDVAGTNVAPEGEVVDVTGYTSSTGTFTHGATTQLTAGDKILLIRDELVSLYQTALPTTPVASSLAYRLSQYLATGDGDWAGGTALASNKSLVDALGQTGADTTVTPDRNAAAIQERIDAITTVMQVVDAAGANGWEEDGSGGNLYSTFNSTDANANVFSGDGGTDYDDNVFSFLQKLSTYIADGDGDFAAGSAMPSNKSIYDITGAYTADGGADDEDTIMAHNDMILADTAALDDMKEKSISKATATIANGNNDLFVVANGPIKILEIVTIVTEQIGAESCDIYYNVDPTSPAGDTTVGSDGDGLVVDGDTVGTIYTWDGVLANDLVATTNGVALGMSAAGSTGLIVPAGSIELTAVHDGTCDGAVTTYMRYVPLASGVTVTAAP